MWWGIAAISALEQLRQGDLLESEAGLSFRVSPYLKTKTKREESLGRVAELWTAHLVLTETWLLLLRHELLLLRRAVEGSGRADSQTFTLPCWGLLMVCAEHWIVKTAPVPSCSGAESITHSVRQFWQMRWHNQTFCQFKSNLVTVSVKLLRYN